jgi:hypothetical protein
VFIGGSTVTATGATAGPQIAANGTLTVPTTGSEPVVVVRHRRVRHGQRQLYLPRLTKDSRHAGDRGLSASASISRPGTPASASVCLLLSPAAWENPRALPGSRPCSGQRTRTQPANIISGPGRP